MAIELKPLSYEMDALEPYMSLETVEYHYGHHARGYVEKLRGLLEDRSDYHGLSLDEVLAKARSDGAGKLQALAGQAANHEFFFAGLGPKAGGDPPDEVARPLREAFGSLGELKKRVADAATGVMGSGWVWLARRPGGTLAVEVTHDADTLLGSTQTPLLVCDVWEHAYYLDYRHRRAKYVEAFWHLVDWTVVAARMDSGE